MQNLLNIFVKHKLIVLICTLTIAVTIFTAAFFASNAGKGEDVYLPGSAEAVMTTPVITLDGKSGQTLYHDELYTPLGIALANETDGSIAVIVADSMSDRIQIISENEITRVGKYGMGGVSFAASGGYVDGYISDAQFNKPADVALLDGDIIVCDSGNHAIRRISENIVCTIAGGERAGYRNGKEGQALFNNPQSVAVTPEGVIYVADTMNHCIRVIDRDGNVALFAGTPEVSGFVDGDLLTARFFEPCGLYYTADGTLYVADSANHSIRKIKNGFVSTVAGGTFVENLSQGYTDGGFRDGSNEEAEFRFPRALVALNNGNIYVADTMNHAVRLISNGQTVTVLGNGQAEKFYESVENLKLSKPSGIASNGKDLYISDSLNNVIAVVPITDELNAGRSLRDIMLEATGLYIETHYAYEGEIRLFVNSERVYFNKVYPWNTSDNIYIPVRPLFEALGAFIEIENNTKNLIIEIEGITTIIGLNESYFTHKGVAVMPYDEIMRLFPYPIEWFPEYSVIIVTSR